MALSKNRAGYWRCFFVVLLFNSMATAAAQDFPGRKTYPDIPFIELEDFYKKYQLNEITVVDVRSSYEYDTLRIKGAINIPLASKTFSESMSKLRLGSDKPIVVYCNGHTCMKSYQAVSKAMVDKITNVVAFDSGIMDFAGSYPKEVILLGKEMGSASKLISDDKFKRHLISAKMFGERVAESSDIVLDVRDRFQREGISIFVGREHRVSLDNRVNINKYIEQAKSQNKSLLIYDASGEQIRWLQYHLEDMGLESYFFMDGGIRAFYNQIENM